MGVCNWILGEPLGAWLNYLAPRASSTQPHRGSQWRWGSPIKHPRRRQGQPPHQPENLRIGRPQTCPRFRSREWNYFWLPGCLYQPPPPTSPPSNKHWCRWEVSPRPPVMLELLEVVLEDLPLAGKWKIQLSFLQGKAVDFQLWGKLLETSAKFRCPIKNSYNSIFLFPIV